MAILINSLLHWGGTGVAMKKIEMLEDIFVVHMSLGTYFVTNSKADEPYPCATRSRSADSV